MSESDKIFDKIKQQQKNEINLALAKSLLKLVNLLADTKDFSKMELKSIAFLQNDIFFREIFDYYVSNKKHRKGKFSKQVLEALEIVSNAIGQVNDVPDNNNLLNLFGGLRK